MLFDSQWGDSSTQRAIYPCIFDTDVMEDETLSRHTDFYGDLDQPAATKVKWDEAQSWLS